MDSQPSSRTGENSPYGMIGGIEETSASFEARSAPRSYPTETDVVTYPKTSSAWARIKQPVSDFEAAIDADFLTSDPFTVLGSQQ